MSRASNTTAPHQGVPDGPGRTGRGAPVGGVPSAPGGGHLGAPTGGFAASLEELRRLSAAAAPLAPEDVPPDRLAEAAAFNGVVARFRELVVAARNRVIMGRPIPAELGFELRALSEALPGERRRAAAPDVGEPSA